VALAGAEAVEGVGVGIVAHVVVGRGLGAGPADADRARREDFDFVVPLAGADGVGLLRAVGARSELGWQTL